MKTQETGLQIASRTFECNFFSSDIKNMLVTLVKKIIRATSVGALSGCESDVSLASQGALCRLHRAAHSCSHTGSACLGISAQRLLVHSAFRVKHFRPKLCKTEWMPTSAVTLTSVRLPVLSLAFPQSLSAFCRVCSLPVDIMLASISQCRYKRINVFLRRKLTYKYDYHAQ